MQSSKIVHVGRWLDDMLSSNPAYRLTILIAFPAQKVDWSVDYVNKRLVQSIFFEHWLTDTDSVHDVGKDE